MSSTTNLLVFFFFISSSYSEPILVNNTCESHNLSSFEKLVFYSNELLKFDYILNLTGSAPFNMNKTGNETFFKIAKFGEKQNCSADVVKYNQNVTEVYSEKNKKTYTIKATESATISISNIAFQILYKNSSDYFILWDCKNRITTTSIQNLIVFSTNASRKIANSDEVYELFVKNTNATLSEIDNSDATCKKEPSSASKIRFSLPIFLLILLMEYI